MPPRTPPPPPSQWQKTASCMLVHNFTFCLLTKMLMLYNKTDYWLKWLCQHFFFYKLIINLNKMLIWIFPFLFSVLLLVTYTKHQINTINRKWIQKFKTRSWQKNCIQVILHELHCTFEYFFDKTADSNYIHNFKLWNSLINNNNNNKFYFHCFQGYNN